MSDALPSIDGNEPMPDAFRASCTKALLTLAIATRERIDEAVIAVYLDDLWDGRMPLHIVIDTCTKLRQTAKWFPKLAELFTACDEEIELQDQRDRQRKRHALLAAHPEPPRAH